VVAWGVPNLKQGERARGGLCRPGTGDERVEAGAGHAGHAQSDARRHVLPGIGDEWVEAGGLNGRQGGAWGSELLAFYSEGGG
jgi:hypothetical protein